MAETKCFLSIKKASPPDNANAHVAGAAIQGGEVALISKSFFYLTFKLDMESNSFEALAIKPALSNMNCFVQGNRLRLFPLVILYGPSYFQL